MVRSETATPSTATEALRAAADRLRRELAAYPANLPDRATAEEELARLGAMALHEVPEAARLQGSLLLVAATLGSVSALSSGLADLRAAVDRVAAAHSG